VALDPALVAALHVEVDARGEDGLRAHARRAVQTSTLTALLDGAYDGDLTIAELLAAGDHGLGTLNGLDGELIVIDGEAWQARVDGSVRRVGPEERTPFAVVVPFAPDAVAQIDAPLAHVELLAWLEEHRPPGPGCDTIRIDGVFDRVHARSVPRQHPPYRPLTEVAAEQHEFTFTGLRGSVVGFRFPALADGLELVGHHLHVLDADRRVGGHVLACDLRCGTIAIERVDELHLELPPGVVLPEVGAPSRADELRAVESEGP
jgi:acetolactate decarboxylase